MRFYECGHSIRTFRLFTRVTTKKWPAQKRRQLATAAPLQVENYDIACGISGHITVEIHNEFLLRNSPKTPLVIYLPPYPSSTLSSFHPPSWLLNSYPVINIPYRWSHSPKTSFRKQRSHAFPIPLHDTLQAYSWLLKSYLPSLLPEPKPLDSTCFYNNPKPIQRPLLIYGSYLGGTLATSLALTESFTSSFLPTKIHSLIVHNGIFDWTPISTTPDPSIFHSQSADSSQNLSYNRLSTLDLYQSSPWTTLTLHALKTRLFSSPSQTFDPFASPILFFRTSGISVPQRWPISPPASPSPSSFSPTQASSPKSTDSIEADNFSPYPDPHSPYPDPSNEYATEEEKGEEEESQEALIESRKSNLIFPPTKSSLRIPRSLFTYSSSSFSGEKTHGISQKITQDEGKLEEKNEREKEHDIFKQQAQQLTKLMRRSVVMHELKERVLWDEDCDADETAKERVTEMEVGDAGLESDTVVREWIDEGGL
ncbi:uncharacterized protein EAF01_010757 [Botrytis porri]|uniref:Alpha/beta hydrolase fold-3 domain-containing protein n=1 Tax=Botrytis porri TaxID=87229 RepID=A0A4Z1K5W3_9HELO|nr:uncharacterized protein EAF01_010757 [Botrytis porri]KAF7889264.1 hypothetical protein EAF01_010757 [Botrytis porri]TGO81048.1 hypothetical protein BPOR_1391g00020 [Botrytis porri]